MEPETTTSGAPRNSSGICEPQKIDFSKNPTSTGTESELIMAHEVREGERLSGVLAEIPDWQHNASR